ncbi:MAG: hypothetical protein WCS37_03080 [Chloroflexota bacterium]
MPPSESRRQQIEQLLEDAYQLKGDIERKFAVSSSSTQRAGLKLELENANVQIKELEDEYGGPLPPSLQLLHPVGAEDQTFIRAFEGHSPVVWSVAFSPDGRTILTGSDDNTARLWDRATDRCRVLYPTASPVKAILWVGSDEFLLTVPKDGGLSGFKIVDLALQFSIK